MGVTRGCLRGSRVGAIRASAARASAVEATMRGLAASTARYTWPRRTRSVETTVCAPSGPQATARSSVATVALRRRRIWIASKSSGPRVMRSP